jgi:transposase
MKSRSSNAKSPPKAPDDRVVEDIRRHFSAEDNIRFVLGLRGDDSIPELCRKEGSE